MQRIEHFVPGDEVSDRGIAARLRWPIPPGVTAPYVKAYTEPGDSVLVPYCQGSSVVREVLSSDRRAAALNFDPLLMLVVRASLSPMPAREVNAAATRLGDSLKQNIPLRRYLLDLYATSCPACQRPTAADYFVWDREQGAPVARQVHCPACDWDGRAALEAEDLARLGQVQPKAMHYYFVLERVLHLTERDLIRSRLESMLALYSPRNLYALAELTLKIEGLFPEGPPHDVLKVALLDCLDRCSSLSPLPGSKARPRGLARPSRFMERNVWYAFEEAVNRLQSSPPKPVPNLAGTLGEFQGATEDWAGYVGPGLVRDLSRSVPPRSSRLILFSPPPLSSAAWSLSYLWGAWLLGGEAVAPLRPLLRQRTPDPTWYSRVMAGSLRTLAGLLRDDGRFVLILTEQRPAVVEALVMAANSARLGISSLLQCGADYRLELTPTYPRPTAELAENSTQAADSLETQIQPLARDVAVETIRVRGEPVSWRTLHAAIQTRLSQVGLIASVLASEKDHPSPMDLMAEAVRGSLDSPTFTCFPDLDGSEELWWAPALANVARPLCDRVEEAAYDVLEGALAVSAADFSHTVFSRFPGPLTPDRALVSACLRAYGREPTPGFWQLRSEDLPKARRHERQTIIEQLAALGRKLGLRPGTLNPFDAAWFEQDRARAVFVVRWQATLSEGLALGEQAQGASPYFVLPGGRAALASHKLAHNPIWQRAVDAGGWRFIKYRHVRLLLDQPEVDQYALETIVGLDPIVEQDTAQLSLF